MAKRPREAHYASRMGWLRAAVLGANDGIVSTACLVLGVAAGGASHRSILLTSLAALFAGATSMAAGEFVSVHSQADTQGGDIAREQAELIRDPVGEHHELATIYVRRGLSQVLADQVAEQLMARDALGAHALDELGLSPTNAARPVQAALASSASFTVGALLPIVVVATISSPHLISVEAMACLCFLASLGALAARVGGAGMWLGAWRVAFWGAIAMVVTAGAGALMGVLI